MDNKKLLKFLFKDIAEIEELFVEKGADGFDKFEVEFIQSRFKGAKQIIQILSEKENKQVQKIRPRPVSEDPAPQDNAIKEDKASADIGRVEITEDEKQSLESLAQFEEELKEEKVDKYISEEKPEEVEPVDNTESVESKDPVEPEVVKVEEPEEEVVGEEVSMEDQTAEPVAEIEVPESDVELDEKTEVDTANNRLGDSFAKEKSVNELLGKNDSKKLEYKISNSPVKSIKASIGINDRYQYIRELFEGSADGFSKAVADLDNLNTIEEAVAYLQENYKWKKNDTSLKFVNLVKRRFANG